jgi:hypothetical protein
MEDYYSSIGANLLPMSIYAKFMGLLYLRGPTFGVKFFAYFVVRKQEELEDGLRMLKAGQGERFRNYMKELHFDAFFDDIK